MKKLIGLMLGVTIMLSGCGDATDGEKIGTFVKVVQKGFFCKTWEAEMIRGGMSGGSGVTGQAFDVTIENNPEMLKRVQEAMDQQIEVKITFHEERATWCRSDSGDNFLTGMTPMTRPTTTINSNTSITGSVAVRQATPTEVNGNETHEQKVERLLNLQAQLIQELARK